MQDKIIPIIKKFEEFSSGNIQSAINELEDLKEENRIHLQRLVFTDLVNRFDLLLDDLLLKFSALQSSFSISVLKTMKESPINKNEVYELFLSQDPSQLILDEIKSEVENKYLRKGHAEKLVLLLKEGFHWSKDELQKPLVTSRGRISKQIQRKKRNNPTQIPGYADWLYSRRNSIVHGDSLHLFDKDLNRLNMTYNSNLSNLISLRLNSIKAASYFYMDLCNMLKSNLMS